MNDFWNKRFAAEEYVYGETPNQFFKQELEKIKSGKILLPGEGEGRNAVFAAKLGWEVFAFDPSIEGRKKAIKLAEKNNTTINYKLDGYETIQYKPDEFDCIALIFTHMPAHKRNEYHRKLASFLKPGGTLILEGFSKEQINNNTGGPRNVEMLFSNDELKKDFDLFSKIEIIKTETILEVGETHKGSSSVLRLIAIK